VPGAERTFEKVPLKRFAPVWHCLSEAAKQWHILFTSKVKTMPPSRTQFSSVLLGIVLSTASALLCIVLYLALFALHSARAALPTSAEDIHEFHSSYAGVTMDYVYLLKARITENEFQEFVNRMKLSNLEDGRGSRREKSYWGGHADLGEAWWNPTESIAGAYHDNTAKGSLVVLAKYEHGYLYFRESCGY